MSLPQLAIFCDGLTVHQEYPHELPPLGGKLILTDHHGEIEKITPRRAIYYRDNKKVLEIRTHANKLRIDGNPGAMLRPENAWNYQLQDHFEIINPLLKRILGVELTSATRTQDGMTNGAYFTRLDITSMITTPLNAELTKEQIFAALRAQRKRTTLAEHAKGPRSISWIQSRTMHTRIYDKLHELLQQKKIKPDSELAQQLEQQFTLRAEISFRTWGLEHYGIRNYVNTPSYHDNLAAIYRKHMEPLLMATTLEETELDELPRRYMNTLTRWETGRSLDYLKPRTYRLHRAYIRKAIGVDIAVPCKNPIRRIRALAIKWENAAPPPGYYLPPVAELLAQNQEEITKIVHHFRPDLKAEAEAAAERGGDEGQALTPSP